MNKGVRFRLMPWVTTKEPFQIGSVRFMPATREGVGDELWAGIEGLLPCFVLRQDAAGCDAPPVVVLAGTDGSIASDAEVAVDILAYSYLGRPGFQAIDCDNFEVWPFTSGADKRGLGVVWRLAGRWIYADKSDFRVCAPPYLSRLTIGVVDEATERLVLGAQEEESARLAQALHMFNRTVTSSFRISEEDRVVWLMTAFEALLGLPRRARKDEAMKSALSVLLGEDEEVSRFAGQLWSARSACVHGGEPDSLVFRFEGTDHMPLWDAGRGIFEACLDALLRLRGLRELTVLGDYYAREAKRALRPNRWRLQRIGEEGVFTFEALEKGVRKGWELRRLFDFTHDVNFEQRHLERAAEAVLELFRKFIEDMIDKAPGDVSKLDGAGWDIAGFREQLQASTSPEDKLKQIELKRLPEPPQRRGMPEGLMYALAGLSFDSLFHMAHELWSLWNR